MPFSPAISANYLDAFTDIDTAPGVPLSTTQGPYDPADVDLTGIDPLIIDSILGTWLNQDVGWMEF